MTTAPPPTPDTSATHSSADATAAFFAREETLFATLLEQARQEDTSRQEMFGTFLHLVETSRLGHSGHMDQEAHVPPKLVEEAFTFHEHRAQVWRERLDREGNPHWISIYLPDKKTDDNTALTPEGVLPDEHEKASPPSATWRAQQEKDTKQKPKGFFSRFFGFSSGASDDTRTQSPEQRQQEGLGSLTPRKARPMRSLFRMLILTAILAAAYHALAIRGWVPRLF